MTRRLPERSYRGDGGHQDAHDDEIASKDLPVVSFASARAWSEWLGTHHASSRGVWLKIAKEGAKSASVTYPEALEGALAWGWIDGQKRKFDDAWWLQRFTPRRPRSPWSKNNRAKAEALIAAGAMQAPGLAEIERAKRDGRWDRAYDGARSSTVPADLAAAFARNARALAFFETLDRANRYAILYRVQTAKNPETRAERIARFVTMCGRHETIRARGQPASRSKESAKKAQTSRRRLNAAWHESHPMPKRPTTAQRIAWHRAHQQNCGCRPVPAKLRPMMR
jgi:uncharacterized protein YdeI (YjbR/CyaY-like superfamily)